MDYILLFDTSLDRQKSKVESPLLFVLHIPSRQVHHVVVDVDLFPFSALRHDNFVFFSAATADVYYMLNLETLELHPFPLPLRRYSLRQIFENGDFFLFDQGGYWRVPTDGRHRQYLGGFGGSLITPSIDGRSIAVFRFEKDIPEDLTVPELTFIDAYEGTAILMTVKREDHFPDFHYFEWSKDALSFAYVADYTELWVRSRNDVLNSGVHVGDVSYFKLDFKWSPKGNQIGYLTSLDHGGLGTDHMVLMVVDCMSGQRTMVGELHGAGAEWEWENNGMYIVYTTFIDDRIRFYRTNLVGQREELFEDYTWGTHISKSISAILV